MTNSVAAAAIANARHAARRCASALTIRVVDAGWPCGASVAGGCPFIAQRLASLV